MKTISFLLILSFIFLGCGSQDALPKPDGIGQIIPQGYRIEDQKDAGDVVFVSAKQGEGVCPHILIIARRTSDKYETIRQSKPFNAQEITFGTERQWPARLDEKTKGYAIGIRFNVNNSDYASYAIKIFKDTDFQEIPVTLGSGYVPRDFEDDNFDGNFDLICLDARWGEFSKNLGIKTVFTQKICAYADGKFKDETNLYQSRLKSGLDSFNLGLQNALDDWQRLHYAISMLLVYESKDSIDEGYKYYEAIQNLMTDPKVKSESTNLLNIFKSQISKNEVLFPPFWQSTTNFAWQPLEFDNR